MAVLVVGGAGYIGSHMSHALIDDGETVIVLDNLSSGVRTLVPRSAQFIAGDAGEIELVKSIVSEFSVDAIMHFAGSIVVPESVSNPLAYYQNNTAVSRNLVQAAVESGVRHFIFSSTAAVYGENDAAPIAEDAPTVPINPYGRSKLVTEWILQDAACAHDFRYTALRYFNVAGADPQGRAGQASPNATHLIKRACQAAVGKLESLPIFGTDYPTQDGTAVRDYIHVADLVSAHALALQYLRAGGQSCVMNCGYGHGSSVLQVVAAVERAAGVKLPVMLAPKRTGDPSSLIADSRTLRAVLQWTPAYDDLEQIVGHAYAWEKSIT